MARFRCKSCSRRTKVVRPGSGECGVKDQVSTRSPKVLSP